MASLPQSPPPKSSTISFTGRDPHCWSKLPLDLMLMVFEILGFADFERAKSVCSSWYSGSKLSTPNNKIPWMILFPEDKNYCLLTNPEDKEKLYKTQHLGDGIAKSVCLTTCRSWLLMHADYRDMEGNIIIFDEKHNLFILNLLTHERINLPAFKSYYHRLGCQILWIDEKTKDYLVIGKAGPGNLVSFKKGDNSWKRTKLPFSRFLDSLNLVYKDHKLYCLNYEKLHIFDFSGEIPLQVTIPGGLYITRPDCPWQLLLKMYRRKGDMVVTVRGDVLFVWRIRVCKTCAFKIFKMGSSKGAKWEKIISLGDESIILDLGITVLAKDVEGMTSNSIYFNANDLVDEYDENELFIFNIDTRKVERSLQFHFKKKDKSLQFVSSSVTISYARWFLPSFRQE